MRTLVLKVPEWSGFRPGQHIDVRLTAEDGYQAQRSYSLASAPQADNIEITVERIEDGEVSSYLVDEARPGDRFEIRGPVGGYFVWDGSQPGPVFLVAGGSGVVPLMSMIRHSVASVPAGAFDAGGVKLLYSSRTYEDIIYREELERYARGNGKVQVVHTLTRSTPENWTGYSGRVNAAMIAETAWAPDRGPAAYVCGPTAFVENVASHLVGAGYPAGRVKTERFGPTGT